MKKIQLILSVFAINTLSISAVTACGSHIINHLPEKPKPPEPVQLKILYLYINIDYIIFNIEKTVESEIGFYTINKQSIINDFINEFTKKVDKNFNKELFYFSVPDNSETRLNSAYVDIRPKTEEGGFDPNSEVRVNMFYVDNTTDNLGTTEKTAKYNKAIHYETASWMKNFVVEDNNSLLYQEYLKNLIKAQCNQVLVSKFEAVSLEENNETAGVEAEIINLNELVKKLKDKLTRKSKEVIQTCLNFVKQFKVSG